MRFVGAVVALLAFLVARDVKAQQVMEVVWNLPALGVDVQANLGDTVRWVTTDGLQHTVAFEDNNDPQAVGSGLFQSDDDSPTASYELTFTTATTLEFFCGVHGSALMSGTLTVGDGGATTTAAATTTAPVTPTDEPTVITDDDDGDLVTIDWVLLDDGPTVRHVTIDVGDTVRWENNEAIPFIPHNVQWTDPNSPFASSATFVNDDAGDNFVEFTFNTPGVYDFFCIVHGVDRMRGSVTVADTEKVIDWILLDDEVTIVDIVVSVGETVFWRNTETNGFIPHSVFWDVEVGSLVNSDNFRAADPPVNYTFDTPGVFTFFCGVHSAFAMRGSVTVLDDVDVDIVSRVLTSLGTVGPTVRGFGCSDPDNLLLTHPACPQLFPFPSSDDTLQCSCPDAEFAAVACCTLETNPTPVTCDSYCGPGAATLEEARQVCSNNGQRLCTASELNSGICCGKETPIKACSLQEERVWTEDLAACAEACDITDFSAANGAETLECTAGDGRPRAADEVPGCMWYLNTTTATCDDFCEDNGLLCFDAFEGADCASVGDRMACDATSSLDGARCVCARSAGLPPRPIPITPAPTIAPTESPTPAPTPEPAGQVELVWVTGPNNNGQGMRRDDALLHCESLGGSMSSLHSPEDEDQLRAFADANEAISPSGGYWSGYKTFGTVTLWDDGSDFDDDLANWGSNHPQTGECGVFNYAEFQRWWWDVPCGRSLAFACSVGSASTAATSVPTPSPTPEPTLSPTEPASEETEYLWVGAGLRFDLAEADCVSRGGHLASITSAEENAALRAYADATGTANYWVGFKDDDNDLSNGYIWTDGSAWDENLVTWGGGSPSVGECGVFARGNPSWFDVSCAGTNAYVCEVPA